MNRNVTLPVALAVACFLGGCIGNYPGGPLASQDRYTYESTPDFPQTITLVNHATGESLWSVDVPVGQQLVIRFLEDKNKENPALPDLMEWGLMPMGQRGGRLENSMPVPPSTHRRVDVTHRRERAAAGG